MDSIAAASSRPERHKPGQSIAHAKTRFEPISRYTSTSATTPFYRNPAGSGDGLEIVEDPDQVVHVERLGDERVRAQLGGLGPVAEAP